MTGSTSGEWDGSFTSPEFERIVVDTHLYLMEYALRTGDGISTGTPATFRMSPPAPPGGTTSFKDASQRGCGEAEASAAGGEFGSAAACHVRVPRKGDTMLKEARIALLLAASACLLAVMVDWVIEELNAEERHEHGG